MTYLKISKIFSIRAEYFQEEFIWKWALGLYLDSSTLDLCSGSIDSSNGEGDGLDLEEEFWIDKAH